MMDDFLERLSALSERDQDRTVETLRRIYERGEANAPEGSTYAEVVRRIDGYHRALEHERAARGQAPVPPPKSRPEGADGDLLDTLFAARELLLRHPVAVRGIAHALMRSGRRFAETDAGRRWVERLRGSSAVERAHLSWEQLTLGLIGEPSEGESIDPAVLLDALLTEVQRPDRARRFSQGDR